MNYTNYLAEIKERKNLGLNPKPIDEAELLSEIILQIKEHKLLLVILVIIN